MDQAERLAELLVGAIARELALRLARSHALEYRQAIELVDDQVEFATIYVEGYKLWTRQQPIALVASG